jgi:LacI family transcriptional regulator
MPDVARAAGVSFKTVSRVANGEPGVSAATASKVRGAMAALGFHRNEMARGLKAGQASASIGLVIGDVSNPFYSAITRSVELVTRPRHLMVVVGSSEEDADREQELVGSLCRRRVNGLLIVPTSGSQRYLGDELALGMPMVFLDRPGSGVKADTIVIDNRGGAQAAVASLLSLGHRRIAMVGDRLSIYTARERFAGYRRALASAGVPPDDKLIVLGPHDPAAAERAVHRLLELEDPPTAFFGSNNRMTVGVIRALWSKGAEAAVVGFDDFELADMVAMPLVVVAHDPREMGQRGAELLLDRIDGSYHGPPRRVTIPTRLIRRGVGALPTAPGRR